MSTPFDPRMLNDIIQRASNLEQLRMTVGRAVRDYNRKVFDLKTEIQIWSESLDSIQFSNLQPLTRSLSQVVSSEPLNEPGQQDSDSSATTNMSDLTVSDFESPSVPSNNTSTDFDDIPDEFFDEWPEINTPEGQVEILAPPPPKARRTAAPSGAPYPRMSTRSATKTLLPRANNGRFKKGANEGSKNNDNIN